MINPLDIAQRFKFDGTAVSVKAFGCGHINDTYCVYCQNGELTRRRYILQRINSNSFPEIEKLMKNVVLVTSYLREQVLLNGGNPERECLQLVRTKSGEWSICDDDGGFWRAFIFIENTVAYQTAENPEIFYYSAKAFGKFLRMLSGFPTDMLFEVIPDFHNTAARYTDFERALTNDISGRAEQVKTETAFVRERIADMSLLTDMLTHGELPLRIAHNDAKLNNALLDSTTSQPVAVIDLDTVMPGSPLFDFGDSIRFGTNPSAEDERDLNKVYCDLSLFEAYSKGFLEECGSMLTTKEIELLPYAAKIMTLECGMRFLADYIDNDIYFKINRKNQNLDRCRTQFKLVADMEKNMKQMQTIVSKYAP